MRSKEPVIFLSEIDWDYLWQRHQIFAKLYASKGHEVFYVNRLGMRKLRISDLPYIISRFFRTILNKNQKIDENFQNIQIVNPIFFPSQRAAQTLNKYIFIPLFIRRIKIKRESPVTIHVFQPSPLVEMIISQFKNKKVVYDCVQNFDEHPAGTPITKEIESRLIKNADVMITDSSFLYEKHLKRRPNLIQVPPGVDFHHFHQAYRGDELNIMRRVLYYGHVRNDLDLNLINKISELPNIDTYIIGKIADNLEIKLSNKVNVVTQKKYAQLPEYIRRADVLLLPYKINEFTSAIIPAKFYECLATGKPILATRMPSLKRFSKFVEYIDECSISPELLGRIKVDNLTERLEHAKSSSWLERFDSFYRKL